MSTGWHWAVGARPQDHAGDAAVTWTGEHCTANGLEPVRVGQFDDRYLEERRADFALTRFTIVRRASNRRWKPGRRPLCPLSVPWILI